MPLLLATHNKAKLEELKLGTANLSPTLSIFSLDDLHISQDPEETGKTFLENSILKAKYYGKLSGLPTIADDGGVMIDILNGEPGVKSKRWVGHDGTDEELMAYTLLRLINIPIEKRLACLQTVITYFNPLNGTLFSETGKISGHIALRASSRPTNGYPYRSLFIVDKYHKYYDELTDEEHKKTNHRRIALERLIKKIKVNLIQ
ncbi:non-canonical purine NTP pyrophosphatase [Candidatus Roizmanbacteria bacterium CG_4_10_14_0_8_um_filter_39_9]|uniref:Non-canonical purine NTP pyrophosphatase n=1 Tax=Candidatus Roizmanbacteria bacterium CG_4_10_14_0_8_um_filter_39_9 TaxID=1974829 RepID=A0A2M7QDM2_9BACT|nr:MAG: non-canonical purine NTP pyrophosphatase [Candidatus Roizmanbacteria bacterium CG_4_10_14_0_8_um_filter_39_9]